MTSVILPDIVESSSGRLSEVYTLPTGEGYLLELLRDVFENYWEDIVFGPVIEGVAYEFRCPCKPKTISLSNGYLTVHFGGTHFHLCIGQVRGMDGRSMDHVLNEARRVSRAEIIRRLNREGGATSWSLQLFNGKGEQVMTIFFANPFMTNEDTMAEFPDWTKLAMWEDIGRRYLGRELDDTDHKATGFF
ncbi:DUF7676 family protein [Kiloniella sp. b19]|uniref:DUF7676 family protein n=1 Tax=Kiloniella sp. GXU_MW_B19 TaxID=3141326 RepID=UPI0031D38D60